MLTEAGRRELTDDMAALLGSYVYVYTDPRDGLPFYVGKGKGNRVFAHLDDQSESEKVRRIRQIRASGSEPRIEFLRYGLSDGEAALVEASVIDIIGRPPLTNVMAGVHPASFGRITAEEVIRVLSAKPVDVRHKALLITINQRYRSGMTGRELYEATRGIWVLGERREQAEYAMAVYQGVVREVYRIQAWHPAGTLDYETRTDVRSRVSSGRDSRRWEFEGDVAVDVRDEYVGFSVGKGGQNPIRYVNI